MSGKSFYAALSMSIAMVGAACWYAWSEGGKQTPSVLPESSLSAGQTTPLMTSTASERTTVPTTMTAVQTTTTPAAEAAAALVHKTAPTTTATTVRTAETTPAISLPMMPVAGEVIQPFSKGELVKSPTTGIWATHNGTDFAAAPGTEVYAVLDGTVIAVEHDALQGVCVTMLLNDGTVTRSFGLNEGLNVEAGDVIPRGTVLGAIGETNEAESSQPPHLHFEVLQNDIFVDPEQYLAGQMTAPSEAKETGTTTTAETTATTKTE